METGCSPPARVPYQKAKGKQARNTDTFTSDCYNATIIIS